MRWKERESGCCSAACASDGRRENPRDTPGQKEVDVGLRGGKEGGEDATSQGEPALPAPMLAPRNQTRAS
eukprot:3228394-Rhodomonas_salina.1